MKKKIIKINQNSEILFGNFYTILKEILWPNTQDILIVKDKKIHIPINFNEYNTQIYEIDTLHIPKNYNYAGKIIEDFYNLGIHRDSIIIIIGWGMLWDIISFVAAIYMRWLQTIFIPTTMMSQADCIIGKIWVNHNVKNLVWLFYSPYKSIIDTSFLTSLWENLIYEWLLEILKHAFIDKSNVLFNLILQNFPNPNPKTYEELIYKSLLIKYKFVKKDPYDKNWWHKWLSLWHTISNYLENVFNLSHWEGILVGLVMEMFLSQKLKYIDTKKYTQIKEYLIYFIKKLWLNIITKIQHIPSSKNIESHLLWDKINNWKGFKFTVYTWEWFILHTFPDFNIPYKALQESLFLISQVSKDE